MRPAAARAALVLVGAAALRPLAGPPSLGAQPAADTAPGVGDAAPVRALGQPPRWFPQVTAGAVFGSPAVRGAGGLVALGTYRPFLNPVLGIAGATAEAYGSVGRGTSAAGGGTRAAGGLRLMGTARSLALSAGADWDARAGNVVGLFSWSGAIRRGGLFGGGTMLRVDWLPARGHTVNVGVTVPLAQPYAGRTRPRHTGVDLPRPVPVPRADAALPPAAEDALGAVREASRLIWLYTNFFTERDESSTARAERGFRRAALAIRDSLTVRTARYPAGRSAAAVQRVYAASLARAFGAAAGDSALGDSALGAAVAERARAGLLDDVLLPYNALFGEVKNQQHQLGGLTSRARARFAAWVRDSSAVPAGRRGAVLAAHARWIGAVDEVHELLVRQWDDSRRIWLPLQLALQPEQYDEQAEVDALIERATGGRFSDGNTIAYVQGTDIPRELARSVLRARDYHVLWVHDYAAEGPSGAMDRVGYAEVADGYLPALTAAVRGYDRTGHLPVYLVLLDQFYYETSGGRRWMTVLDDPLGAAVRLPAADSAAAAHLRARQQELRDAVAGSRRLQAEAARARPGRAAEWLRAVVRVHVNVTQPSDVSFRSHRILPPLPFVPDNLMRDHRKIAFWDATEAAPDRGGLLVSGTGVGENYSSPTWDDRGLLVRGPAVLEARAAARRLLGANGIPAGQLPAPLREAAPQTAAPDTTGAVALVEDPFAARALQVHNEPGFGSKRASVARAMLYSLAGRGRVVVVPDPLWLGGPWAGMVAGAALRGAQVQVIAPARANAPSAAPPVLAGAHTVLERLLTIGDVFGGEIARAGGALRVGLYADTSDVHDVAQQAARAREGIARTPWIRALFPFDSAVLRVLDTVPRILAAAGYEASAPGRDLVRRRPQLHMKVVFVADSAALAALLTQPQWPRVLGVGLLARARQTSAAADPRGVAYIRTTVAQPGAALLRGYERAYARVDGGRRTSFYLAVGTQNHDPRSMMLDAEATVVVSGAGATVAVADLWFLLGRTTWVTRQEELDALLPPPGGFVRWLARYLRLVL